MKNQIKTLKNDLNMKKIEIQEYISQLNKKNDNSVTSIKKIQMKIKKIKVKMNREKVYKDLLL